MDDLVSRKHILLQLSHNLRKGDDEWELAVRNDMETVRKAPSVTPSVDGVSKEDVLGWLLAYHTKSFDLKGRYYPREVIGWLVADISKNLFADTGGKQDE